MDENWEIDWRIVRKDGKERTGGKCERDGMHINIIFMKLEMEVT